MRNMFSGAVLVALGCMGCQSPAPQFTQADEAAVRALFDSTVATVRSGRMEDWATLFTEDARFHPSNGPALTGKPALLAWGKAFPPMETFTFGTPEVHGEGNLAYGWSSVMYKMTGAPADTSKQLVVFHREADGQWKVVAVSLTSDLALPAPPAK